MRSNKSRSLENLFFKTIRDYGLLDKKEKILIGLSGGADSVLLAFLFSTYAEKLDIIPAACHINHGLRPEESKRDEAFARQTAAKFGMDFASREVDAGSFAKKNGLSVEMAARELRYRAFSDCMDQLKADKIATAHHLDDLAETLFFRLLKGTGISGLIAIPIQRNSIIRPLLFVEKKNILDYLSENDIPYIVDSSNFDESHDRNYIRNSMFPLIEKRFPSFRKKIGELYRIAFEEEKFWRKNLEPFKRYYRYEDNIIFLDKVLFQREVQESPAILRRFIRHIIRIIDDTFYPSLMLVDSIIRSGGEKRGNKILYQTGHLRVISSYNSLIFCKGKKFPNISKYVILKGDSTINYRDFVISVADYKQNGINKNNEKEYSCVFNGFGVEAILIRPRKDGDRIKIKNGKSKKIKDFFIDNKFNLIQRENSFIIETENGRIITVFVPHYGFRVSSDFYIVENTADYSKKIIISQGSDK